MKIRLTTITLIEVVMLLTASLAQQPRIADPEAERILDRAAQAEGVENVPGMLRTLRLTGAVYWGPSHLMGDFESIIRFPDKFCDTFAGANGKMLRYGFDGTEPWIRGIGGDEPSGLPRLQLLLPAAQWRLRYTEARFIGQREIGKRRAYVVRGLVRGQFSPADYYYDPDSYLLLQVDTVLGRRAITYQVSHFETKDGLTIPREWSFGQNRTDVSSIKLNPEIDDRQFAKPN